MDLLSGEELAVLPLVARLLYRILGLFLASQKVHQDTHLSSSILLAFKLTGRPDHDGSVSLSFFLLLFMLETAFGTRA